MTHRSALIAATLAWSRRPRPTPLTPDHHRRPDKSVFITQAPASHLFIASSPAHPHVQGGAPDDPFPTPRCSRRLSRARPSQPRLPSRLCHQAILRLLHAALARRRPLTVAVPTPLARTWPTLPRSGDPDVLARSTPSRAGSPGADGSTFANGDGGRGTGSMDAATRFLPGQNPANRRQWAGWRSGHVRRRRFPADRIATTASPTTPLTAMCRAPKGEIWAHGFAILALLLRKAWALRLQRGSSGYATSRARSPVAAPARRRSPSAKTSPANSICAPGAATRSSKSSPAACRLRPASAGPTPTAIRRSTSSTSTRS